MQRTPAPSLRWTFAITAAALFMFALDRQIVGTALPSIRRDLGTSVQALAWTVSAYTLILLSAAGLLALVWALIAVLGTVFAAHGGTASADAFLAGVRPALLVGAAAAAAGGIAACLLPREPRRAVGRELEPLPAPD